MNILFIIQQKNNILNLNNARKKLSYSLDEDKLHKKFKYTYLKKFKKTSMQEILLNYKLSTDEYDIIKKYDKDRIIPVNVADKNVDEEFLNMRAQLWFRLREAIISGFLGINPEIERNETEIFISQITDIKQDKVSVQNSGKFKVKIESKKDMASRGISSPDYGDATILSFYYTKEQLAQRLSIGKYKPVSDAYSNEDDIPKLDGIVKISSLEYLV